MPTMSDPLSPEEQRSLILQEMNLQNDPDAVLFLEGVWRLYDGYRAIDFQLPYLYAKRRLIQMLQGRLRGNRDWKMADVSRKDRDLMRNLTDMLTATIDEINILVGRTQSRPPAAGPILAGRFASPPNPGGPIT